MIFTQRPAPPGTFLEYPLRLHQLELICNWFSKPPDQRTRRQFSPRWTDASAIVQLLRAVFANKCAFCESTLVRQPDELLLTHFRPTEGARQRRDGIADSEHYWWLSWEWTNLYLACPICIREKGDLFPTSHRRAAPSTYGNKLQVEKPLLLDPCLDDPSKHLHFNTQGEVVPRENSPRGRATIDTFDLNRKDLRQARADSARDTLQLLQQSLQLTNSDSGINELKLRCKPDQPFAGSTRQLIRGWLDITSVPLEIPQCRELINELDAHESIALKKDPAFHSCFISYSNKDYAFGEKLRSDLEINGVGYWFAPEHMKIGNTIHDTIIEAIKQFDKLLVIISKSSLRSDWVKMEVEEALKVERIDNRQVLFPIYIDKAVLRKTEGWAAPIFKDRFTGDFHQWRNEMAYQRALERLLHDLKR